MAGLIDIERESVFALSHSLTLQSSSLKLTYNASESGWDKKTVVSSAKLTKIIISDDLLRSSKYSKNNNRPKIGPYGIPESTTLEVENVLSTATYCLRSVREVLNKSKILPLTPICCNFFSIIL